MDLAQVQIPDRLVPVFALARGAVRYRAAWGGRGSGKSYTFALMALLFGYAEQLRILATRDLQISIKESFHAELAVAVKSTPWLDAHYEVGESYITGRNGTEFIFRGLRHNISSIRSMARIDLCIIEEAEDVPEQSWRDLLPTVRADGSEIWAIWNPRLDGSPVDTRLRKRQPADAAVAECHYWDNPWFPDVLDRQRRHDQQLLDPATYAHIWEGAYLTNSAAQVLAEKVHVEEFVPGSTWDGPYLGLDWGFSQDPLAAVKCWISDQCLYIEREAGRVGVELDETAAFLKAGIPGIERWIVRADNARPESISYVKRHGLPNCIGVEKWPNSVEEGIRHLRSYRKIVIHPRCRQTIQESRLYSYKVDRLSGDILPTIVDAHNHYMDAIRYAIQPMVKTRIAGGLGVSVPGL